MKPTLSIVIPSVGRSTLKMVVKSILKNKNFDQNSIETLIVFDNLSPKPTLKKWLETQPNVSVLQTPEKVFAGGARNLGIEKAQGPIIAFLQDDTILASDWLERTLLWHQQNPASDQALLGRIHWSDQLAQDPFHAWLDNGVQFDFPKLDRGQTPDWRHFYTANLSLKRDFLGNQRFNPEFKAWGFEDAELGYRLSRKGLRLHYEAEIKVFHDDPQTLKKLIGRTQNARLNAQVFQALHPEIRLLPRGPKKIGLQALLFLSWPLSFIPQVRWWGCWKKAWLGAQVML